MIVKDASVSIRETLESYKNYINYWLILDTGSTDGTQQIILDTLKNVKGRLCEEPFKGFTISRNRALDLLEEDLRNSNGSRNPSNNDGVANGGGGIGENGGNAVFSNTSTAIGYIIMPDDTYILNGGQTLLKLLKKAHTNHSESSVLSIKITGPDCDYYSNRILKVFSGSRYEGPIHECLMPSKPSEPILKIDQADIFLLDKYFKSMHDRSIKRWNQDLEILLDKNKEDPTNPRWSFYLGMTYYAVDNHEKSIEYFEKRVTFDDDYKEEKFISYMNIGIITYQRSLDPDKAASYFLRATKEYPARSAEPLYKLAQCYKTADTLVVVANKSVGDTNKSVGDTNKSVGDTNDEKEKEKEKVKERNSDLYYMFLKEASRYPVPTDYVLFTEVDIYKKHVPKACVVEAIQRGHNDFATEQLNKLKFYNTETDTELSWFINEMFSAIRSVSEIKQVAQVVKVTKPAHEKDIVVFVTGNYWHPWNGSTEKLGGSETMIKMYAEYLSKQNLDVYAFIHCDKDVTIEGVHYRSNNKFPDFVKNNLVKYCVISRYPEFLNFVRNNGNVLNVFFWVHDIYPCGTPVCDKNNFRCFILLSEWHKEINQKVYNIPDNLIKIVNNTIDIRRFSEKSFFIENSLEFSIKKDFSKKPWSFCYTSWYNRGLSKLLEIFPYIQKEIPEATLDIYTDIPGFGPGKKIEDFFPGTKTQNVNIVGRVSQKTLAEKLLQTEFWIYPAIFNETYCISALEAMAAGCICIYNNIGALGTTIGRKGIVMSDIMTENDIKAEMLSDTVSAEAHSVMKTKLISRFDPKDVAMDIIRKIKKCDRDFLIKEGLKYAKEHDVSVMGAKFHEVLTKSK